jgi:type II secretory pathway pseudopilin PulG
MLDLFRYDTTRVTQVKFADYIEKINLESSLQRRIFLTVLIAAVLLAALISALFYQKSKLAERSRKISEAQQTINSYNQKISELSSKNQTQNAEEIDFLRQKVKALELKFSEIYTNGKNLYAHVLANNKIGRWSKEDYRNFIDYYQSLEFLYVRSFETDFVSLTDRQKIFLILCHIGKSKEQIMHIMTLEESSFRSMKSRIEAQKVKNA